MKVVGGISMMCASAPMIPLHLAGVEKERASYNPNVRQRRLRFQPLIVSLISVTDSGGMQSSNTTRRSSSPHL